MSIAEPRPNPETVTRIYDIAWCLADDDEVTARLEAAGIHPSSSPWPVPPIEGIPFDDDSEEARAIERIIAW